MSKYVPTGRPQGRPSQWTDERKAEITAVIEVVHGGSVHKAAAALGLPESSIRRWYDPPRRTKPQPRDKKMDPMPKLPPQELIDGKRTQMTDIFERIVARYASFIEEADLANQKPVQAATVVGILFDKLQIMRGQPTHITQTNVRYMEVGSLREMAKARLKVLEGGKSDADVRRQSPSA